MFVTETLDACIQFRYAKDMELWETWDRRDQRHFIRNFYYMVNQGDVQKIG